MTSAFKRQFLPMAVLVLLAFVFLGVSFHILLYGYIVEDNEERLRHTAQASAQLAGAYGQMGAMENNLSLYMYLSFAADLSDTDTLILNEDGQAILCSRDMQNCAHTDFQLPEQTLQRIYEDGEYASTALVSKLYGQSRLAVAIPISSYGRNIGAVISSMPMDHVHAVLKKTTGFFAITALCVLAVILVFMLVVARKQNRPIREMAAAARQLGRGALDTRVTVGGKNTREIDELAVAFNNMAASLQSAETQRQEFVANVSHELKTPMTTIAGYMDGMLDGTIPPQKHAQYMQIVSAEVRRLSRLVRNMLDISRMQSQGIAEDKKTRFDICGVMGEVLLSFEQRINAKQLEVLPELPEEPVYVWAERDSITQVVYNLMDNAIKFCNEKGQLYLHVRTEGAKVYASVENTGATIPSAELPLIFERFHKTDKSRSVDREGVGLGLYIVKTILCSHGEDITVSSGDGRTAFTFTLPWTK